jgi:hypothetical protein
MGVDKNDLGMPFYGVKGGDKPKSSGIAVKWRCEFIVLALDRSEC